MCGGAQNGAAHQFTYWPLRNGAGNYFARRLLAELFSFSGVHTSTRTFITSHHLEHFKQKTPWDLTTQLIMGPSSS